MTKTVNLNAVKWGQLCQQAEWAGATYAEDACAELARQAGRLTTVTAPHSSAADTAMTTSFRWDCTAFGLAPPSWRPSLAPGLLTKARLVRAIVEGGEPDPAAVVVQSKAPLGDAAAMIMGPAWMRRADIGGA
jgi:hypothetical protein